MRHCPPPALFAFCLLLAPLTAQTLTHLSGQITDPSGAAVPGAIVSVSSEDTGFRKEGVLLATCMQEGVVRLKDEKDEKDASRGIRTGASGSRVTGQAWRVK